MQRGTWTQTALAAVLVLVLGAAIAVAGEQTIKVKVIKGDGQKIEVDRDGAVEVIELADLADGEERSIDAGDHAVLVKRVGDELMVTLDGSTIPGGEGCGAGEAHMVWVTNDELDSLADGVQAKRVIMIRGDEGEMGEHKVIKIKCGEGEDCEKLRTVDIEELVGDEVDVEALRKALGGERIDVQVSAGEHGVHPMVIKSHVASGMVRFTCPEDDTTLSIAKAKATQDHYMCPVCGREMKQSEGQEVKMLSFVARTEGSADELPN